MMDVMKADLHYQGALPHMVSYGWQIMIGKIY